MTSKSFGPVPKLGHNQPELLPDGRYRARTKSFVRRGNRMAVSLQNTWDEHASQFVLDVERTEGVTSVAPGMLDLEVVFGRVAPLIVEVGTGTGDQIVAAADEHPENNYLGLEVWRPGIAKTVSKAVAAGVNNLRIIEADAVGVLRDLLPEHCATEVWTFYPDPWRKARHHKRRLVQQPFAELVARALIPGGTWRLATDWDDYAWWMRDVVEAAPQFTNPHAGERPDPSDPEPERGGFAPRFEGRVRTRFENRGLRAGRTLHDLRVISTAQGDAPAPNADAPGEGGTC